MIKDSRFRNKSGFTLVEIIVVVAIFALIITFALIIDLNAFKRDLFRAELSTIVSVLEKARSRSMANMFESAHGVCYDTGSYIIFRDGACDGSVSDEAIPANTNIIVTFFPTTVIVFDQLTGKTASTTISITDGIKSGSININNEGAINW